MERAKKFKEKIPKVPGISKHTLKISKPKLKLLKESGLVKTNNTEFISDNMMLSSPEKPKLPEPKKNSFGWISSMSINKGLVKFSEYTLTVILLAILVGLVYAGLRYRSQWVSKLSQSIKTVPDILTAANPLSDSSSSADPNVAPSDQPTPSPTETTVLGSTTDTGSSNFVPAPIPPSPTITPAPLPSSTPTPLTTSSSSTSSCAGTPTADDSQVYVNGSSSAVTVSAGSSATVTVDLQDCNNNKVSNDNLNITLSAGDSDTTINGKQIGSGYSAQAQNGEYSFQVSSANATTVILNVQDTSQNFQVTMPGYKPPEIIFGSSSSGSSNSSNPNCTTGTGVPNSWYSDVYPPSSPQNIGSIATFSVTIRDCNKNVVSSHQTLTISLSSGDSSTTVNGSTPPISITTSNGSASFNITSQNATTDNFKIEDTTASFEVTTTTNGVPSVTFSSPTSSPTPTPAPTPSSTPTSTPTTSASPTPSPSTTPSPS